MSHLQPSPHTPVVGPPSRRWARPITGEHPIVRSRSCYVWRFSPNQRSSPPGCEAESRSQQYLESTPHEKVVEEKGHPQTTSVARRASQGAWQWYRGWPQPKRPPPRLDTMRTTPVWRWEPWTRTIPSPLVGAVLVA